MLQNVLGSKSCTVGASGGRFRGRSSYVGRRRARCGPGADCPPTHGRGHRRGTARHRDVRRPYDHHAHRAGESERAGRLAAQWLRAAATPGVTLDDPYNPRHALEDVHRYVRTIASAAGELAGRAVTTASSPPSRGPSSPNGSSIGTRQGATSTTRWRRAGAPCQAPEGCPAGVAADRGDSSAPGSLIDVWTSWSSTTKKLSGFTKQSQNSPSTVSAPRSSY